MTEKDLDVLVTRATVRIGPESEADTLWGSGFFVAPGWVLSCAHVLPLKLGQEGLGSLRLRVRGQEGLDVRARPAYWLGGGADPEQDLVLVRLTEEVAHTCVRLTDRCDAPGAVTGYGWRTPEGGAPKSWSGRTECNGTDGAYGLTLAPMVEIPRGASGGPLLDRGRGLVAGVVKARRAQKDGGLAIAVTALRGFRHAVALGAGEDGAGEGELGDDPYAALIRAHDIWHRDAVGGDSWVDHQDGTGAGDERRWGPRDSAEASARLAGLPEPDSPVGLRKVIEHVLGKGLLWPAEGAPRDWRDGHGWLYEHEERADLVALHYLRVVAHLCESRAPGPAAELGRWVVSRARRLPPYERASLTDMVVGAPVPWAEAPRAQGWRADLRESDCAEDDEGPVVAVELTPDNYRPKDHFHWRIWTWIGGPETVQAVEEDFGGEGVSLAKLEGALMEPLMRTFGQLDGARQARLEVALPVEHFGVDVRMWQPKPVVVSLRQRPEERRFGVHRQVVLRSLKRRGEPASVWRERWRGVAEGEPQVLYVKSDAYARQVLDQGPPGAVPVLCRTPAESTGALSRAIEAGYGVALWNLQAEHPHGCGADCADLQVRTDKLLSSAGRATALPELLHTLREDFSLADPKKASHPDVDWAQHLALLYDDPRRPIPLCDDLLESP